MQRIFLSLILLFFAGFTSEVKAQLSNKYTTEDARFYKAEDLYEKEKYAAAQEEFKLYLNENTEANHPYHIKAQYYIAVSALYLYQPEAEKLLLNFINEYPESIYRPKIYLELGRYYYRKKKYDETVYWLNQIDIYDLDEEEKAEFYFKRGYAHYQEEEKKAARDDFYEVINKESQYQSPALYYYSHIAYEEKNYQTALEGFLKLTDEPAFENSVPYYITQIYYQQGKKDALIDFAPEALKKDKIKNKNEISLLLGDTYYSKGMYAEAVPHLEAYNLHAETTRDEDYQLGFAYYKSGEYDKAVRIFDKVSREKDELGQIALYHIAQCYMAQENFVYARNAFKLASDLSFDADIEEDALYQFAVLSYKLDYDPFNDAMKAFELYLDRYPNSHRSQDVYQYLVNVYTTMGNYFAALNSLENIKNKDFELKNAYQLMAYNYGVQLFVNGNMPMAIETFKKVKTFPLNPKLNALSVYYTAEAYFYREDYPNAIAQYRLFLGEPGSYTLEEHNDAYYNIGYAYFRQEDYDAAAQNFRTFTQDPKEMDAQKKSDAYLRIGDCYFIKENPEDDKAIEFYQKAIDSKTGQVDYAHYQVGIIYGYQRKYTEKAKVMSDLVKTFPTSPFLVSALYETGEAYRLMDDAHSSQAIEYYNKIIIQHPAHPKVVDAIFQIGVIHFINGDYRQAEKQFLKVVREFDDPIKKREAIEILEDVYTALNEPEKYIELLKEENQDFDEYYEDTLLFNNAFNLYEDSLYSKSIVAFNNYLSRFERPIREVEALFYLGMSYKKEEDIVNSVRIFEELLTFPNNTYTEYAALIASQNMYEGKQYDKAIKYYQILEENASYPENRLTAQIGLMRCYALKKEFGPGKLYAQKVLNSDLALANAKLEANYVLGKAEFEANNWDLAMPYFKEVSDKSSGKIGAESHYHIALIHHLKEDYKTSEEVIRKMLKEKAGYDYWIAKALLLQVKNSIGVEDYVQAEYTLNSVLNGYKVEDDGILDEAREIQKVLEDLKNKDKEIDSNEDNTIEIGNDD